MWCNKWIFIFVTLLGPYTSQNVENNQASVWKSLENIIKKKCLKNANQNKYEEVLRELTDLKNLHWHSIIIEEPTFEAHPHVHCHLRKPEILGYLERFASKLESCIENEEKYLQQFILKGYENYSRYFCNHIKPLISDLPGNTIKCITKFREDPEINPHGFCYKQSKYFKHNLNLQIGVITKQELCEDLLNMRSCYAKTFSDHCPDASMLQKFQLEIISEGLSDCHDVWYSMLKKYLKMQV